MGLMDFFAKKCTIGNPNSLSRQKLNGGSGCC
jgi:hypothetical protein